MQSPDNTVISLPDQSIVDEYGNIWSIVGGQVAVNGVIDPTTANVIEMAFENGTIWQKNTDNLWWSKTSPGDQWSPPYGTEIDPIPGQHPSANDAIVTVDPQFANQAITDASGNNWSIVNGQVTLNGVADPTTGRVIELAYVNGAIWQENADQLWWSKTKPSDAWGPTYGTSINPVADVTRTWFGGSDTFANPADWTPNGVPQAGDTAVVTAGSAAVPLGFADGVNFSLQGTSAAPAEIGFRTAGAYSIGTLHVFGVDQIDIGTGGQKVALTTGGIHTSGGQLRITEFISGSTLAIHGNSSLANGATLDAHLIGTASLPHGPVENDGTMTVNASTLAVGQLTGEGIVRATGGSTVSVISASAGEAIQLQSAHLYIGDSAIPTSTAMQFLAPVTHFGDGSVITLNNTQATSEVFAKSNPTAGELFLYNGSQLVADMHISGQSQIYATDIPAGPAGPGSVLLTPYDTGHTLPIASG